MAVLCYVVYWLVARKFGADKISTLIFLSLPQLFFLSHNGSLDWMIPLGYLLPPWIGLFILLAKPQIGIGIALYWFIIGIKDKKYLETLKTFAPVTIAYSIFFFVFRPQWQNLLSHPSWDASIWPYGIPFGIVLLLWSIISHDSLLSITVSPFFSPYIGFYSLPAAVLGLSNKKWLMIPAVLVLWVVAIMAGNY